MIIKVRGSTLPSTLEEFISCRKKVAYPCENKLNNLFMLLDVNEDWIDETFPLFIERLPLLKQTNDAHYIIRCNWEITI